MKIAYPLVIIGACLSLLGFSKKPELPENPPSGTTGTAVRPKDTERTLQERSNAAPSEMATSSSTSNAAAITSTTARIDTRDDTPVKKIRTGRIPNTNVPSLPLDDVLGRIRSNGYDATPEQKAVLAEMLAASLGTRPRNDDDLIRTAFTAADRFILLNDIPNALIWYANGMTAARRIVTALPTPSDVLMLSTGTVLTNALVSFADGLFVANAGGGNVSAYDVWDILAESTHVVSRELAADEALYASALVHYVAADHGAALDALSAIVRPERFPSIALYRALMQLSLGRYERSFREFDRISERHDTAALYHNRSLADIRAGRTNEALTGLTKAHREKPGTPVIAYNLGSIYRARHDLQKAAYYYTRASDTDPRYSPAAYALGLIFMEVEDYPRALMYLSSVESNGQSSTLVSRAPLFNNIAVCLMNMDPPQNERALQYAERAVTESAALTNSTNWTIPMHAAVLDTKADVLAALGRYSTAADTLTEAMTVLSRPTNRHPNIQGDIDEYQRKQRDYRAKTNR
ncbi:MAG: tetratricopeptide repeat protein [Spirochaetota bacterium]